MSDHLPVVIIGAGPAGLTAGYELVVMNLAKAGDVADGVVYRQPAVYPVYDGTYREPLGSIRAFLATFANSQTIGRSGMHRYNNMDHSMLTAMLAVKNLWGEAQDLWTVNMEQTHHEARTAPRRIEGQVGGES